MMKKMTRILVLVAAVGLCVVGLGACGKRRDGDPKDPTVTTAPTPTDTVTKISTPRKEIGEPEPTGAAMTDEEAVAGEWFATLQGLSCRLTLTADGTYAVDYPAVPSQEKTSGKWALEGDWVLLDDKEDDRLAVGEKSLLWERLGVRFTREAADGFVAGAVRKDATLADFGGYWVSAVVMSGGVAVDAADAGEDTDLYIEDKQVLLGGEMFGDAICSFDFADGALVWSDGGAQGDGDGSQGGSQGAGSVTLRLELTDADYLKLTMSDGAESLVIFLVNKDVDQLLGK